MLSIEIRKRLVSGYERTHDAKMIAQAYGVRWRHNMVDNSNFLPKKNMFIKVPITAI